MRYSFVRIEALILMSKRTVDKARVKYATPFNFSTNPVPNPECCKSPDERFTARFFSIFQCWLPRREENHVPTTLNEN